MAKNITQKVVFKNTSPKALYDLYMNAKNMLRHCAPAKITNKPEPNFLSMVDISQVKIY